MSSYGLWLEAYDEMNKSGELEPSRKKSRGQTEVGAVKSLRQFLYETGIMPDEGLLLGAAYDSLPVLLNMSDPVPQSILVQGDVGSGKTEFLKFVAEAIEFMHEPDRVQFSVISRYPDEFSQFQESSHCTVVSSTYNRESKDLVCSLAVWAHGNKNSSQYNILLIDDVTEFVYEADNDTLSNLRWLLLRGSSRKTWVVGTSNTAYLHMPIMGCFKTRITGLTKNPAGHIDKALAKIVQNLGNREFAMPEHKSILKFYIPELN